ncbi:MAG: hypothetical protein K5886_11860 [Lachnospiraceae bacterium]|nr:hypothetical protein [Lachnospiraceae bacterium]
MKTQPKKKEDPNLTNLKKGINLVYDNDIFGGFIMGCLLITDKKELGKNTPACSTSEGKILVNRQVSLEPKQWAYAIAHCILHNCFGHYDLDKVPGYIEEAPCAGHDDPYKVPGYTQETPAGKKIKKPSFSKRLWNMACDIYIDRFLDEIKFGKPLTESPLSMLPAGILDDENRIYDYLLREGFDENNNVYGVGAVGDMDMRGLEKPLEYGKDRWGRQEKNEFSEDFAFNLAVSVSRAINSVSEQKKDNSFGRRIAGWFINAFPLLGAIAASFEIVEDIEECRKLDISVAAVDAYEGVIYLNTAKRMSYEEWRFVMAHEFLHAALLHHKRSAGKEPYLWNIATDYVINDWLFEMQIGVLPEGVLYDPSLKNRSAEEIYDMICLNIREYMKKSTFRGNGQGDIMGRRGPSSFDRTDRGVSLDEFYRSALSQGLEYELGKKERGFLPAGLIEEIRALSVPPIPWDVRLSEWFNAHIRPVEKHRSYAHPSRRQSCTPDIPRARYIKTESDDTSRTFGVIIDTSGSMAPSDIGKALGAVASYAASREVPAARVVFCDAAAYDAGYLSPDDIAGRVKVIGRGGTRLQPAVDLLQSAKDFPKDGPVLIITDGGIESHLDIKREHAYILPAGSRLPFRARGEVFYM